MADLLPRKAYRRVLKALEHYRKQDEEDRRENPGAIPCGWRSPITHSVEQIAREEGVRNSRQLAPLVVDDLVRRGILVNYAGDVSFPEHKDNLPTADEIKRRTLERFYNEYRIRRQK